MPFGSHQFDILPAHLFAFVIFVLLPYEVALLQYLGEIVSFPYSLARSGKSGRVFYNKNSRPHHLLR